MQSVTVGLNTTLLIPSAWDCFTYRGFLYVRDEHGRFVVRGAWSKKAKVA